MYIYIPPGSSAPQAIPYSEIPCWHRKNLQSKVLMDTDRKYIVQTLATMLMTHIQRPPLQHCGVVAKALVTTYPFLRDDGDVEVWHM